ncbi:hypothetical protein [Janthinobacterium sp. HLX7-2]|uniref:hypothetical protein n=1 Tax=Janthinobacterium sp. HLX7-2 TaxID=1259331 RepID=UPI003F26A387
MADLFECVSGPACARRPDGISAGIGDAAFMGIVRSATQGAGVDGACSCDPLAFSFKVLILIRIETYLHEIYHISPINASLE